VFCVLVVWLWRGRRRFWRLALSAVGSDHYD